jgi:hypothetical protein
MHHRGASSYLTFSRALVPAANTSSRSSRSPLRVSMLSIGSNPSSKNANKTMQRVDDSCGCTK